ncbi:hypothetical protein Trydic_g12541 [Trypoxylus dichotomus]
MCTVMQQWMSSLIDDGKGSVMTIIPPPGVLKGLCPCGYQETEDTIVLQHLERFRLEEKELAEKEAYCGIHFEDVEAVIRSVGQ